MTNPVVLIATHDRVEITEKNIISLMMQGVQPKIVLGVSDTKEYDFFKKKYPEVHVYNAPNNPLGYKWQSGVDYAKKLNPNPLIILGSDDILGIDFVKNACIQIKSGFDFVGLSRWYVFNKGMLYQYDYNTSMPLGGGRCYSLQLLKDLNFKLFDTNKNKHLDDFAWKSVNASVRPKNIIREVKREGLNIVSIKGDWPMLNPFDRFQGNKNVTLLTQSRDLSELKQLIDYEA